MKRRTIILAVLLAVMFAGFAVCEDQEGSEGRGRMRGRRRGSKGGHNKINMILRLGEKLELTEEQIAKLEKLRDDYQPDLETSRAKIKEAHEALREAVEAGDEEGVKAAAKAIGDAIGEQALLRISLKNEVDLVLTPEQKEKLEAIKEEFRQRKEERKSEGKGPRRRFRRGRRGPDEVEED